MGQPSCYFSPPGNRRVRFSRGKRHYIREKGPPASCRCLIGCHSLQGDCAGEARLSLRTCATTPYHCGPLGLRGLRVTGEVDETPAKSLASRVQARAPPSKYRQSQSLVMLPLDWYIPPVFPLGFQVSPLITLPWRSASNVLILPERQPQREDNYASETFSHS
jgi:hypothetical protein